MPDAERLHRPTADERRRRASRARPSAAGDLRAVEAAAPAARPVVFVPPQRRMSAEGLVLGVGDGLAFLCAVAGGLWLWRLVSVYPFDWAWVVVRAAWLATAVVPWLFLLMPAHHPGVVTSVRATAAVVVQAAAMSGAVYLVLYFLAPRDLLPRFFVLSTLGLAVPVTVVWRLVFLHFVEYASRRRAVVVVGDGPAARTIARVLRTSAPNRTVVAVVADGVPDVREPGAPDRIDALGLRRLVTEQRVDELVLASSALGPDVVRALVHAQNLGVEVMPMQTVYEHLLQRVPVRHLESERVLALSVFASSSSLRDVSRMAKRVIDVAAGFVGCIAVLAVLPLLGPLVLLGVGRPILFRQQRVGRGGRVFEILKFRTMRPGAERDGPQWASPNDSRVTLVGRLLRRCRLDEIPQFWNVLAGHMSVIGPRPERPEFVDLLEREIPFYRERLAVRPGLTGWAQVNYRYGSSVEDAYTKLEYDLYYIKHRNNLFDFLIALRTVWTVLAFGGR